LFNRYSIGKLTERRTAMYEIAIIESSARITY
jgi:hypothetical protein